MLSFTSVPSPWFPSYPVLSCLPPSLTLLGEWGGEGAQDTVLTVLGRSLWPQSREVEKAAKTEGHLFSIPEKEHTLAFS